MKSSSCLIGDGNAALHAIFDDRLAGLRRLEADDRRHARRCRLGVAIAPGSVVADRAAFGARLLPHRFELLRCAEAVVGLAFAQKLACDLGVASELLRLEDDLAIPFELEPAHAVDDGVDRFLG